MAITTETVLAAAAELGETHQPDLDLLLKLAEEHPGEDFVMIAVKIESLRETGVLRKVWLHERGAPYLFKWEGIT